MNVVHRSRPAEGWKPFIYCDMYNEEAKRAFKGQVCSVRIEDANVILVLGGDGTMIKAITELHKYELPFYGINYGHVGFLLNDKGTIPAHLSVYTLPLLSCECDNPDPENAVLCDTAVNDIWVERASPQAASLEVSVDRKVCIPKMYSDGLLVSTPQGSTAYARAMGGIPIPLTTQAIQLVGNNVGFPNWKSALLGLHQEIKIRNLDVNKRPLALYADGRLVSKEFSYVRIKVAHYYVFQLIFDAKKNLHDKISSYQFPK